MTTEMGVCSYALAKPSKDSSYNTSNSKARIQLLLYVNCYLHLTYQVTHYYMP